MGVPQRATDREGYDNQPQFLADGSGLVYSSIGDDGSTNIHLYDLVSGESDVLVATQAPRPAVGIEPRLRGDRHDATCPRVQRDSRPRLVLSHGGLDDPLQIHVEGEHDVLARHGRNVFRSQEVIRM